MKNYIIYQLKNWRINLIQWAFPDPDPGVKNIELDEAFKHGSMNDPLDEFTLDPLNGLTLQFASIFDLNCSTIFSN